MGTIGGICCRPGSGRRNCCTICISSGRKRMIFHCHWCFLGAPRRCAPSARTAGRLWAPTGTKAIPPRWNAGIAEMKRCCRASPALRFRRGRSCARARRFGSAFFWESRKTAFPISATHRSRPDAWQRLDAAWTGWTQRSTRSGRSGMHI